MPIEIVLAGDPVLRQRGRRLTAEEIRSREIQELIEEMREAMRLAPGVGLAAPQAGYPLQPGSYRRSGRLPSETHRQPIGRKRPPASSISSADQSDNCQPV